MQIKEILYTSRFERSLKRVPPNLTRSLKQKTEIFRTNCFDPRLKTHKLHGSLDGFWSFSITYSYRILFAFTQDDKAAFVDIGNHSIYSQ